MSGDCLCSNVSAIFGFNNLQRFYSEAELFVVSSRVEHREGRRKKKSSGLAVCGGQLTIHCGRSLTVGRRAEGDQSLRCALCLFDRHRERWFI